MSNIIEGISSPTLLLDEKICKANIKTMVEKAKKSNTLFRPHFKTHQSAQVGSWFKEQGVTSITVSSVKMAMYFVENNWDDITIAFPFNVNEAKEADELASKINLNLLVESISTVEFLKKNMKNQVGVFIKIDTGYHRAGILSYEYEEINRLLKKIKSCKQLVFKGFLSHAGHSYYAKSRNEIEIIYNQNYAMLTTLKHMFIQENPDLVISTGDTPTCSIVENFDGIDEIRPGVFAFYDLMQYYIGSCSLNQIAIVFVCPIVAKHKHSSEFIVYGGGAHLSKDFITTQEHGIIYGLPVGLKKNTWTSPLPDCRLKSISQEHGIIEVSESVFEEYNIGDFIGILPIHACMVVNSLNKMTTTLGKKITCMPLN